MLPYQSAIGNIESRGSGDYSAIGPRTRKGNHAYGRYGVMDFNIGPWTEKVMGRAYTPQEFLADRGAQDAVFNHYFGEAVNKHGPQGAAAVWFSGKPNTQSTASDGYNTVSQYVDKFNKEMGGDMNPLALAMAQQPAQAPALSTQNIMGPGALSQSGPKQDIGQDLQISSLFGRDNPAALGALGAVKKNDDDDNVFSTHVDPTNGVVYRLNRKTGEIAAQQVGGAKRDLVDPSVLKTLNEDWGAKYGNLHYTAKDAARFSDAIRDKKLDLSAYNQWVKNPIGNLMGSNDEGTKLLNEFHAFRTRMANDSLRLNAGVQTEGDAQRAQQEFASGTAGFNNDAVRQQLDNFVDRAGAVMNDSAKSQLDSYLGRYGNSPALTPFSQRLREQSDFYEQRTRSRTKPAAQPQQQNPALPKGVRSITVVQ
jgi:hypothetical protein